MKKILLVINSHQTDTYSINFACNIAQHTHSKLTGVFVEDPEFRLLPSIDLSRNSNVEAYAGSEVKAGVIEKVETKRNIKLFKDACANKGVDVTIGEELGGVVNKITYESRFADILIIDPATSFDKKTEAIPTHFVRDVLANAECPVIISPDNFEGLDEVVFCYDGSASSVFAIKQFTYLFPEYSDKNATILHINTAGDAVSDEGNHKIHDWLKSHYASVNFHVLEGKVRDELFTYLLNKRKQFIVMGAYGRSILSNFFKKSSADLVMRVIDLPLFITHH